MKLSIRRLAELESRLSGRIQHLDTFGHADRADVVDVARRRVQRVRERLLLEQSALALGSEAA